jgi:hypothetical protein
MAQQRAVEPLMNEWTLCYNSTAEKPVDEANREEPGGSYDSTKRSDTVGVYSRCLTMQTCN